MTDLANSKVAVSHLKRDAYVYVRQSTLQQLAHNTESTQRHGSACPQSACGWDGLAA